eukprot:NODE_514_length_7360_cov_0.614378.p2 type:complete len:513 gc:universal NODE_514_length_7360_cov_0.614378:435-1973(+)
MLSLLTFISASSIQETYPDVKIDEGVVQLTKDNFDSFINAFPLPVIVEFYAPWCGFCKKLKPEYEAAAKVLWDQEKAPLVKVDCTEDKEVCDRFGVEGFPTLKVFSKNKKPTTYEGERTKDGVVDYIVRSRLPPVTALESVEKLKDLMSKFGSLIICHSKGPAFKEVAESIRDVAAFVSVSDKIADAVGKSLNVVLEPDHLFLLTPFLEAPVAYGKISDAESLSTWIKRRLLPVLGSVTPENFKKYSDSELPLGFIFYKTEDDKKIVNDALKKSASDQWGAVNFGFVNGDEHADFAESLGLEKNVFPAMSIQNLKRQINFPYKGEWKKEALTKFVNDFVSGKLKPHLKSDAVPENKIEDHVTVVVGTQFEEIVLDKTKDVLVELYAPWCGFCKKLAPVWSKLAEHVKGDHLVIAKMDGTTNDMPLSVDYSVKGFPSILFFKAKDNKLLEYNSGNREATDFYAFLKENAHYKDITANEAELATKEAEDEEEEKVVEDEEDEQADDEVEDKEEL